MNVQILTTPWQRSRGAMFQKRLGETVLLFAYPHAAPRLFHTFCCQPLRIIALSDEGEELFNQVKQPGQFVRLPASRLIVEADPEYELSAEALQDLAKNALEVSAAEGTWDIDASVDRLLFALFKEAIADMRRVHEAHARKGDVRPEVLRKKFAPWERGQLTNSASFLLDFSHLYNLPETALHLSWQVLDVEKSCLAEITAASLAGVPWKAEFPIRCLRCGNPKASWRLILTPPPGLMLESTWRYDRPENHVPLCHRCATWLKWKDRENLRFDLAQGLWGQRHDSFMTWHKAAKQGRLPADWDRESDPLWPRTFGGDTWETGSGSFAYADPRPPDGVSRTNAHLAALSRILKGRGGVRGKRGRGKFTPWLPLINLAEKPIAEFV